HMPSYFLIFLTTLPPPTHIYTLSLHDALPIYFLHLLFRNRPVPPDQLERIAGQGRILGSRPRLRRQFRIALPDQRIEVRKHRSRSEEHTSELQSRFDLVCRLLLEKKKIHNKHS